MVAVALVLAIAAFAGVVLYASNVRQAAYQNAKLVKVFKVEKDVAKGFTGELAIAQDYVRVSEIPQEYRPGSAINSLEEIKGKVALTDLSAGQVLVTGQFVDPAVAQVTTAQQVPAGQMAVTVSIDQIHGVAGLLLPGDKVNAMVIYGSPSDAGKKEITTMYQNVNIMAIGTKTAPQAGATTTDEEGAAATAGDTGLITFSLPIEAAERMALAGSGGPDGSYALYLTLVPPDNQPIEVPAPIGNANMLTGLPLTPYPAN